MKKYHFVLIPLFLLVTTVMASTLNNVDRYIGYTIFATKTIAGYQERDGKKGTDFQGCDFGRVIIFDDNTILHCGGYGYQYAYRPDALILVKGTSFKMIVENNEYDMQR